MNRWPIRSPAPSRRGREKAAAKPTHPAGVPIWLSPPLMHRSCLLLVAPRNRPNTVVRSAEEEAQPPQARRGGAHDASSRFQDELWFVAHVDQFGDDEATYAIARNARAFGRRCVFHAHVDSCACAHCRRAGAPLGIAQPSETGAFTSKRGWSSIRDTHDSNNSGRTCRGRPPYHSTALHCVHARTPRTPRTHAP